jgi:hypothetical protein
MSLINDALIKAERDRAEEAAARAAGLPVEHPKYRAEKRRQSRQLQSIPLALINTGILLACFAIVIFIVLRNRPDADSAPTLAATSDTTPTDTPDDSSTFAATAPTVDPGSSLTPSDSPFESSPVAPAEPPASADFELVGMSAVGGNTLLSVVRRSDQRSVWIPVGKSVAGITAVSYDAESDRAVIRVNGREHTLGLRTAGPVAAE